ncbi:MAG TPA: hypothetical protein VGX23_34115 [Actinocrinis sp.]|nr:hypothetical protein [Actinocrinis sp.]
MTDEVADPAVPQSYMMLLPMQVKSNFTVESLGTQQSGWGPPLVTAAFGKDDRSQPWLLIANETPLNWLRLRSPAPKSELEVLHLQRLATDYNVATGRELYDAITPVNPGADPPDIYAEANGEKVGWELTIFGPQQRRQAQALFGEVVKRLVIQQRYRVGHLSGFHVSMWFGTADDVSGLPFKSNDAAAYDRLVDALMAHQPDPTQYQVPGGQFPKQLVGFEPVHTVDDVRFMSVPLLGGAPATALYAMTGMSVGLAFQSDHIASDEWARLRKVVAGKDKPTNDRLLISVGAPDTLGRCFLSEEVLARFLLDHPEEISAKHLSSVVLHFWSTGRAVELLGTTPTELWPAIYQGINAATHPFVLQSQQ